MSIVILMVVRMPSYGSYGLAIPMGGLWAAYGSPMGLRVIIMFTAPYLTFWHMWKQYGSLGHEITFSSWERPYAYIYGPLKWLGTHGKLSKVPNFVFWGNSVQFSSILSSSYLLIDLHKSLLQEEKKELQRCLLGLRWLDDDEERNLVSVLAAKLNYNL